MGLYLWLSRAGKYTAQLSEKMTQLRESGDETRKTDQLRMQRLEQLAQKQRLSNSEMTEAERLTYPGGMATWGFRSIRRGGR